jgi:hypothetical protein
MDHKQEAVSYFSINVIQNAALWASNSSIFSDEEVETHTSLRFLLGLINVPPSPYSRLNPGYVLRKKIGRFPRSSAGVDGKHLSRQNTLQTLGNSRLEKPQMGTIVRYGQISI